MEITLPRDKHTKASLFLVTENSGDLLTLEFYPIIEKILEEFNTKLEQKRW